MPLTEPEVRLYARQLALPEIGSAGMQRLRAAAAVIFAEPGPPGEAAEAAALYLRAAGVGRVTVAPGPEDPAGWGRALAGHAVAVRFVLDDDALLTRAAAAGVPLVLGRVRAAGVDLLSLRRYRTCGHPTVGGAHLGGTADRDADAGAAAVVAATLAASEALLMIVNPARAPAARLLRLSLDGGPVMDAEIPWPPPCPICDGAADKVIPS